MGPEQLGKFLRIRKTFFLAVPICFPPQLLFVSIVVILKIKEKKYMISALPRMLNFLSLQGDSFGALFSKIAD